jgi:hypothetical protein
MGRSGIQIATLCLSVLALGCWVVMFLAGTDVWHDTGRPDLSNLPGAHYADVRAFAYAFYLLFAVLSIHAIVTALDVVTRRRRS